MTTSGGYRGDPAGGPRLRSDIVDVYIFHVDADRSPRFLQLHRAAPPLDQTWQPVMGHIEQGETAISTARRELEEEVGLHAAHEAWRGFWALEQVYPYFVREIDCVVLSPRFAAEVDASWSPRLNAEHTDFRWIRWADVERSFMWPGQKAACREIVEELARPDSLARDRLRIDPGTLR